MKPFSELTSPLEFSTQFSLHGSDSDHFPEVLGISLSLSEAEIHWGHFFEDLQKRGMNGLELIISDGHVSCGNTTHLSDH